MSLRMRMLLMTTVCVTVPMVLVTLIFSQKAKSAIEKESRQHIHDVVTGVVDIIRIQDDAGEGVSKKNKEILKNLLQRIKLGETGYIYAINTTGRVTLHPTMTIGTDLGKYDFCKQMMKEEKGWVRYQWEGRERIDYFEFYPERDWIIVGDCLLNEIYAPIRKVTTLAWFLLLGAILVSMGFMYRFVIEYVRQMLESFANQIRSFSKAAVSGQLKVRLDPLTIAPELRPAANEMNTVVDAVVKPFGDVSDILGRLAAHDLTARITTQYEGDYNLLKESVNRLANSFEGAVRQIATNTTTLTSSAEELSAISHQVNADATQTSRQAEMVSSSSDQVSKNVQTVATGSDEMSASIKEIAENTAKSARVTTEAVQVADQANITITKLGESSTEIDKVIKMITSVAEQTSLLALNATIEAARAGTAGKGFAVVANEVKELATETAKATEEISLRIQGIQANTKEAIAAIVQITDLIKKINDITNTIASAVEQQSATTNEITRNVSEAAKGTGEIAKGISGVAKVAGSTAQATTNVQAAAQELAKIATELQKLVSEFKYS
ncbi:MAG: methyl-accepting chemotaxis protein [Elusimicrobiota bacterium]